MKRQVGRLPATKAADVDMAMPALVIHAVTTGTVQKWDGSKWVWVSISATAPLAQRLLLPGQKIRWIPPTGVIGGPLQAVQVKAWDPHALSWLPEQGILSLPPGSLGPRRDFPGVGAIPGAMSVVVNER